ncbi:hypothetical protein BGZ63DRAFT_424009 [Mariannaea sp. PMI_226]|nr:hypothetical protein BGZ63DRAFT_424009 [Mariannaea sp. PMI_226]
MLAAHRDQENLVHSHQASSKQHLKTPGARYPKTPSRFGQHDENAPTAFTGKTGLGGAKQFGNDKTLMKTNGSRQAMVTPMGTTRAPLGNKTTNAKARTGQTGGAKGKGKEMEKSELKPTAHRPKQPSLELAPPEFKVKSEQKGNDEDEPEYAPPKPKDLPYESDCFPKDLLTFEGLKSENLLKGYYQHFYNPVDEEGVSRQDREFEMTMRKVMTRAEERNQLDMNELDWNIADIPETVDRPHKSSLKKKDPLMPPPGRLVKKIPSTQPSTISSRRAASALSMASDTSRGSDAVDSIRIPKTRKPLSTVLQGKKPVAAGKNSAADSATGEAASRTTIGYNRGRTTSSMIQSHRRIHSETTRPTRAINPAQPLESFSDMTITPARLRRVALKKQDSSRPQFMALFDEECSDDEDIAPISKPLHFSDDEEEFELKLDF